MHWIWLSNSILPLPQIQLCKQNTASSIVPNTHVRKNWLGSAHSAMTEITNQKARRRS